VQLGEDVADVVVGQVAGARLGDGRDGGGGLVVELCVHGIDRAVREEDGGAERGTAEKLGGRHQDRSLLAEPPRDEVGVVPHLAGIQDGHDAVPEFGGEGIGHRGGRHDETRLGPGDGVQHHDGGGVRRQRLPSLGLDDGVVVGLTAPDVEFTAAGDELDGLHGGEVVERGELLAHVHAVAAERDSLGEESTLGSLGGARANLAGARDEGDDVTALGAIAEIGWAVLLRDGAREGAGRENRL